MEDEIEETVAIMLERIAHIMEKQKQIRMEENKKLKKDDESEFPPKKKQKTV